MIAIGSIFTESNHLGGKPTCLACYERTELRRGAEVLATDSSYLGGMLQVLRQRRARIVPLIVATACPAGPLTAECYRTLKSELLERLAEASPVDGILLPLHGAASADGADDLEGDLLQAVREVTGADVPIVVTLDLHANVTHEMVRHSQALIALETYPHRDTFETGRRGAEMLLDILDGNCRPTMAMGKVPVLVGAIRGHTEGDGPFAGVMRFAKSHEGKDGVLSTSAFLVQPYLDVPEMGGGGLVITDDDMEAAVSLASSIADRYWQRRFDLDPPISPPAEAIRKGLKVAGGPILLVETADCCGGGAAGDSVTALKALIEAGVTEPSMAPVVDPEAAACCHATGVGRNVTLSLGHKVDPQWGQPVTVTGTIVKLSDGHFIYRGGTWGGQEAHMGPSAVLRTGSTNVLITTHATYDWADEQFAAMDLDARTAKFVVVKNPMNYRLGYKDIAVEAFILDTPGPTPAVLHHVRYKNVRRPYYPADREITDPLRIIRGNRS